MKQIRQLIIREPGLCDYHPVWNAMQAFTAARDTATADEIWLLQHPPVYTLGRNGRIEHLFTPGSIPVLRIDRGGEVTYHGPGQLLVYTLIDMTRLGLGIRTFVDHLEQSVIELLGENNIRATLREAAPGVYVDSRKVASIGLRVRRGRCYHGLSLNVNMDLEPFTRIRPCGLEGMEVTQLTELYPVRDMPAVGRRLCAILADRLGYTNIRHEPEQGSRALFVAKADAPVLPAAAVGRL